MATPKVKYCSINREVEVSNPHMSILDVSIENKIPHLHECGGNGRCTTCRVRVINGSENLSKTTVFERDLIRKRNWDPSIRLACQAKVYGDVSIQRLVWTNAEISKLQLEMLPEDIGQERALAILFCDMRNFTVLASKHPNYDLAHMLNLLFTSLGDPILMNNGIIYQYVGDEIIGLFGTTGIDGERACMDAIRAALGMKYALDRLNRLEFKDFNEQVEVGIGIHYGRAFVGNLGHPKHKQFSVLGDPVNVASRIQDMNKELNTNLLVSEEFLKNLPDDTLKTGINKEVNLKGKKETYNLIEILGFKQFDTNLELQASMELLLKDTDDFAKHFYDKLFDRAPAVRDLFKKNMLDQGRMLTHMLGGIIYGLSRPEHLEMGLSALGKQHMRYGVEKEHYPVLKEVLLETIEERLGEFYKPEILKAWNNAIDLIAGIMTRSYSNEEVTKN
ncbi:adenylate/guanylate cyclase domain-containing protein [Marinigracilibium pacificum]|uniref:2Fe-2S iron-sulfur cluster binding domain-containing protein n=1 Tax=Marinigracilibium pacificum TaxID=2729599 RepID=A0A848J299_9BACT|nr:adenylate/guanylate cyclase domain-containing protein [Marinigracilibium pacificum]NMM47312.1 2Fe-2S iron-sulfur cluster binding domain-containing protein [Marinigracilibium pacificum]